MKFQTAQRVIFLILLIGISVLFFWVIKRYLYPIFWAAILAIIFYPLHQWWLKITNNRSILSTSLTLTTIVLIVLIPLSIIGNAVVQESLDLYQGITSSENSIDDITGRLSQIIPLESWLGNLGVDEEQLRETFTERAQEFSQYIIDHAASVGQNTVRFIVDFAVMLYILYHFIRHGPELVRRMIRLLPIGDSKERLFFEKFSSTARATIKGTLIIGLIQGFLGGVLFWIVGIPSPVLWGALMTVLAVIPAVGTFIVWAPAGIILLIGGNVWEGVVVLIVGGAVLSTLDNILRPPLIGKDTKMPDAVILIATLGGLSVFGISGFIIGPIIAALFLTAWHMFEQEYSQDLNKTG